jgi:hypothetical protein
MAVLPSQARTWARLTSVMLRCWELSEAETRVLVRALERSRFTRARILREQFVLFDIGTDMSGVFANVITPAFVMALLDDLRVERLLTQAGDQPLCFYAAVQKLPHDYPTVH